MGNPKKVEILGHVLLVLIIVGFAALVSRQAVKPYLTAKSNLGAFRAGVKILTEAEGNLDRLDWEIVRIAEEVASKEATLPININLDAFLEEIGGFATQTAVRIENLSPEAPIESRLYREMNIRIDATGTYPALHGFISMLEEGQQLSRIEKMTMVGRKGQPQVNATLVLALYFSPERAG